MVGRDRPSRARRAMPASRAIALVRRPSALAARRRSRHSRSRSRAAACRSSATPRSSSCCATTPRRSCKSPGLGAAERAGRADQRARLQRVRDGRPPHLRECRRAVRLQDAERDHRRARARDRPYRRRASVARCASSSPTRRPPRSSRMLLGVGAIAAGAARPAAATTRRRSARPPIQAPQEMIRRSLLSYQRAQEESADRAA